MGPAGLIIIVVVVAATAAVLILIISRAPGGRIIGSLALLAAALVCGFLFLAGFEHPGVTTHKLVTGCLGVLFLMAAIVVARKRADR